MKLIITLILAATPALGQTCFPQDAMRQALDGTYGEQPRVGAILPEGGMVEFWGNSESRTWTLIIVTEDGQACLITAGEGFSVIPAGEAM